MNTNGCCLFIWLSIITTALFVYFPITAITVFFLSIVIFWYWAKTPKQRANRKLQRAKKSCRKGSFSKAVKILTEARRLDPTNREISALLGLTLYNAGKFDAAILHFKYFLRKRGPDPTAQFIMAKCFYETKKYQEAIKILQHLPENPDRQLQIIRLLGACFAAEEQHELAINVFKTAPLSEEYLDEELIDIHYNLALAYKATKNYESALEHLKIIYAHDIAYRNVSQEIIELENEINEG